jgi:hypothetical protein
LTPEAAAKHSFLKDSSTQEHDHSR